MINAAAVMMHERGYAAVGVADICREADSKKGSFYHYFDSKQALAIEMLEESWQRLRRHVFDVAFADPGEGDIGPGTIDQFDRYGDLLAGNLDRMLRDRGLIAGCLFGNFANEMSAVDPEIAACLRTIFADMTTYFASAIEAGQRRGEIDPDIDPTEQAVAVLALMEGLMTLSKTTGQPAMVRRLGPEINRLLAGERT